MFLTGALALAGNRADTALTLQIGPEAWLSPSQIQLEFVVPEGGGVVSGQSVTVHLKVRTLPDEVRLLTANVLDLQGPGGPVPVSEIRWNGGSGPVYTVERSGTFTVAITFSLIAPADWPPGLYSGRVDLSLQLPTRSAS
jgi:hypothetical protein